MSQDIEQKSKDDCMHLIIKHYAVVVKDVYRKAGVNKNAEEEGGDSPSMSLQAESPRKGGYNFQHSFNQSNDSISFEQLSKGLHKKSFEGGNNKILTNLGSIGLWSNSTIDMSVTAQV